MRILLPTIAVMALLGCGGVRSNWSEDEALITDSEISSLQSALTTTTPTTPAATGAHVKVTWGYLAGRLQGAPGWIDWTGSLKAPGGKATLESLVFFDRHDATKQSASPEEISWKSRTLPHFDGFIALVEPGAAAGNVELRTASYSHDYPMADLAKGVNLHEVIDADGHEVSVSSIPAGACGGFAYGYEKPAKRGNWLGFGGRFTDATGTAAGRLRFRVTGNQIQARLTDDSKQVLADGIGTATKDTAGGTFELTLDKADGTPYGTVSGIYQVPSYSTRGAFQATWRCP